MVVAAEAQFIAAGARVDVAAGTAKVASVGVHLLAGLGIGF
jgi:hypothetical protein